MTLAFGSAHRLHGARRDLECHAHFAGARPGIFVLAEVFLRQGIDVAACTLLGHPRDLAAYLQVAVRIVGIHDGQRDRCSILHVARLGPPLRAVHADDATRVVEPHWRYLRRSVGHQRRQFGKCLLLLQQVEIFVGDRRHGPLLVTRRWGGARSPTRPGGANQQGRSTMPSRTISFFSEGVRLAGDLFLPGDLRHGETRPGIVLCHGYTGVRNLYLPDIARVLTDTGYVVLTFDYKGWGDSEGPRSRLAPYSRVIDSQAALTWLAAQDMVDAEKLGIYG